MYGFEVSAIGAWHAFTHAQHFLVLVNFLAFFQFFLFFPLLLFFLIYFGLILTIFAYAFVIVGVGDTVGPAAGAVGAYSVRGDTCMGIYLDIFLLHSYSEIKANNYNHKIDGDG